MVRVREGGGGVDEERRRRRRRRSRRLSVIKRCQMHSLVPIEIRYR